MGRVAALGCLVCGRPAAIHHVMKAPGKVRRRDHRFIAPLCGDHHQGDEGVHGLGSEAKFLARWGIDLAAWSVAAWERRDAGTSNAPPCRRNNDVNDIIDLGVPGNA